MLRAAAGSGCRSVSRWQYCRSLAVLPGRAEIPRSRSCPAIQRRPALTEQHWGLAQPSAISYQHSSQLSAETEGASRDARRPFVYDGNCVRRRSLGDTEWLDASDVVLEALCGVEEINGALGVHPELRRIAEQASEAQGHLRTHRSPTAEEFVDGLARDARRLGQPG